MAKGMRLHINPPIHGWAVVRLVAPDVELEFAASYTPSDSIGDLARAATELAAGVPEQVITWNTEAAEYDFRFVTANGWTRLEVQAFPDYRRQRGCAPAPALAVEDDAIAIARAIWRGLRRLQGSLPAEEFATAWRHPFPAASVGRLGEQLREQATQG